MKILNKYKRLIEPLIRKSNVIVVFYLDKNGVVEITDIITSQNKKCVIKFINPKCIKNYILDLYDKLGNNTEYFMILNIQYGFFNKKIKRLKPKTIYQYA